MSTQQCGGFTPEQKACEELFGSSEDAAPIDRDWAGYRPSPEVAKVIGTRVSFNEVVEYFRKQDGEAV